MGSTRKGERGTLGGQTVESFMYQAQDAPTEALNGLGWGSGC